MTISLYCNKALIRSWVYNLLEVTHSDAFRTTQELNTCVAYAKP